MNYSSDIKRIKEFTLAKSVAYNFVLSIFITLALAVIVIYASGIRLDIVLSDSMSPTFYRDDIVIVKPCDDYDIKDIIEYKRGNALVTHRIIDKVGSGSTAVYITKGDATSDSATESVKASLVNGKVIDVIEDGKGIYDFVKSNYFLFIDIILGIWVLSSVLSGEIEMRKHNIAKAE